MGHKYQPGFNVILRLHNKLGLNITHYMVDKSRFVTLESRNKDVLAIGNNIVMVMSIEVKALFV
jgi:hypothetical protein